MPELIGKYSHERNENLDEYFQAVGVPYFPRKMMILTSPQVEISLDEYGQWAITASSLLRTTTLKFKLGEEYEERMPGGITIKSTTTREGDTLKTVSMGPNGKVFRTYDFSDTHCIINMKHEQSGTQAKRYFKRVVS